MRYPAEHKAQIRERILAEGARALREEGLDGVSVQVLMERVGLTHGGFYNHFADRDALVAEAVARAAAETGAAVFEAHDGDRDAVLGAYLSPAHADARGQGCVLAALGGEAAHATPQVRSAFAKAARGFLAYVQRIVDPTSRRRQPDDETLVLAAQMIGAVVLARLVDDATLANRILAANRRAASA